MYAQDESQHRTELRLAFLRHLPKRVEAISQRGQRFCSEGWDINGLTILLEDVQRLAGASGRYGALESSEKLLVLETLLGEILDREMLPDEALNAHLKTHFSELGRGLPDAVPEPAAIAVASDGADEDSRIERPPANYWRRWAPDADAPVSAAAPTPSSTAQERSGPASEATTAGKGAVKADRAVTAASPVAVLPQRPTAAPATRASDSQRPQRRIYHLADGGELACALDQRLESLGYEMELLESADELREILAALAPDLVIVDAAFTEDLEGIGVVLRATRERTGTRLPMLVLAPEDTVPMRLLARRAGADAMLVQPQANVGTPEAVAPILGKLEELLISAGETTYRILIVEDDRSQALFAESILRNAGMDAQSVYDTFEVLNTMERFKPDLVLMDLYMPHCDGTELTALIREREEFLHTPIVFLSGESDEDKHFEALSAGGDDFLAKPIRPKHLIAAVNNRVRRARALQERAQLRDPRDPATGLHRRSFLLDRLNEALGVDNVRDSDGGAIFIEVDGIPALRERLGLSSLEQMLTEVSRLLVESLDEPEFACRYGDGSYVIFSRSRNEEELEKLASRIRGVIISHPFQVDARPLRLRIVAGVCAFRHGFADAGALLNATERAAREARASESGVHRFEPPKSAADVKYGTLLALIRNAIEADGFELLFQPIVALQGGEEAQYQTLLRLRDDDGRLHLAGEIVPLAESADLIVEVDRWVLTQALRVIEQRRGEQRPLRLFVNQSALSVLSPDHADWLLSQLAARQLPGELLTIELGLEDVEPRLAEVKRFCDSLTASGVQFCLSRFDGDAQAEEVLQALPLGFIKIAPKYLAAVQTPALRDELRAMVERGHRRGLKVIGQRVEDAQAAATLWMSGIDYIQGNLVQQAARELEFDFHAAVL